MKLEQNATRNFLTGSSSVASTAAKNIALSFAVAENSFGLLKLVLSLWVILFVQATANAQFLNLSGTWEMYNEKHVKYEKLATITQNGSSVTLDNSYGDKKTVNIIGFTITYSGLIGTISANGYRINWSNGYVWEKRSTVPEWQKGIQLCPNFETLWGRLSTVSPVSGEVESTYSVDAFLQYTSGINHVQGLAWSGTKTRNKIWAIAHDKPVLSGKNLLLMCNDPTDKDEVGKKPKCTNYLMGKHHHPGGGMQIMGEVIIMSDENDTPRLYRVGDIDSFLPIELPCKIPNYGGSAGIVWDPDNNVHVIVLGSGGGDRVYVSNGRSLDDPACVFSQVGSNNALSPPGEGLSQLFYSSQTRQIVSIGGVDNKLKYQYFTIQKDSQNNYSLTLKASVEVSVRGAGTTRWGATIRMFADGFDVVMADSLLTRGGPVDPDMLFYIYRP